MLVILDEIMIKNDESLLLSETNQKNLLIDANIVKYKKRKSKKNSNEFNEIIKKKKIDNNTLSIPLNEPLTFDTKPQTNKINNQKPLISLKKTKKIRQIKEDTNSVAENKSNTFDKTDKKKKNKKSRNPLVESNEISRNEKKKLIFKLP